MWWHKTYSLLSTFNDTTTKNRKTTTNSQHKHKWSNNFMNSTVTWMSNFVIDYNDRHKQWNSKSFIHSLFTSLLLTSSTFCYRNSICRCSNHSFSTLHCHLVSKILFSHRIKTQISCKIFCLLIMQRALNVLNFMKHPRKLSKDCKNWHNFLISL